MGKHEDALAKATEARMKRAGGSAHWPPKATSAYRMLHLNDEGANGLTIDSYSRVFVVNAYRHLHEDELKQLVTALRPYKPVSIYLKRRPKEARVLATVARDELAPDAPVAGEQLESLPTTELGLRYEIRPAQGLSVGLYLDARDARAWVRANASGKTVLNCFSYTCGFAVAAHAGGAARVLNIDLSRRVLDWGEANARLNAQPVDRHDYVAGDVFEWLHRLAKKGETFDLVVLDPPSFSSHRGRAFSAARDYGELVAAAEPVVAAGGRLLACCNLAQLSAPRFEAIVRRELELSKRKTTLVERLRAPEVDFPGESALKGLVVELG